MQKPQKIKIIKQMLTAISFGDTINVNKRELKMVADIIDALSYQIPKNVTEFSGYPKNASKYQYFYEICPKCDAPLHSVYQSYCSACGQNLKWISYKKMTQKSDNQNKPPI